MYIFDDFPTVNSDYADTMQNTDSMPLYSFGWRLPRNQRSTQTDGHYGFDRLYISCVIMGFVWHSQCKASLFVWTQMRA